MVNKENLLRIKIDGHNLIKISSQHQKRDFTLTFPPIRQNNYKIESHFTLHTPNNRVTFKTTSIKVDNIERIPLLIKQIKDNRYFISKVTPKDLDLYGGIPITDLNDTKKINYIATIALNMENSELSKYFDQTKTSDAKFKYIKKLIIPPNKNKKITIKFGFGRNFTGNITSLISKQDDYFIFKEKNNDGNEYTFILLVSYDFPKV